MRNESRSPAFSAAVIILLTVVAYLPAFRGGFVFDDSSLIVNNPMIRASDGLHRFWFTTQAPDYYPLTWSFWWLEWRLWGAKPLGYHAVNILLHASNAVFVWLILRKLKIPGAWFAGLVFAVHPVNVATVAWISEQKSTLSMLFYAVAILSYLRFDEEAHPFAANSWGWYVLSLTTFLLALLSKTAVVMLPIVLMGCVWWLHSRVRWKDFLYIMPFFALSLVLGLVTVWFQHNQVLMKGHTERTVGFASRLATAGWVPWFYLCKALLPFDLMTVYPKWEVDASRWVSYMPGVILVGWLIAVWWKRKAWGRPLLFGLGYFVVMLFPVLGFFDQAFYQVSLVADHWQYYSIVGVIALAVAAVERIRCRMGERRRHWSAVGGVAVLMALGVGTWERSCVYANDITLWQDNVARNQNVWLAQHNLGVALQQEGKTEEAIEHYEQALRIKPDYADAHNNLGNALLRAGRIPEAIGHYEQALRIKPQYAGTQNNLGNALLRAGRIPEAIGHYEQALRINPDLADVHLNLGVIFSRQGKLPEAIPHFEQALRIEPDDAEAHCNLANALAGLGKVQEAIGHWEQALRIKPDYDQAHYDLGVALVGLGRVREAMDHWEQVRRISPNYAEAQYNLGVALEQAGKTQEAIGHYKQALQITPDYADARNRLARLTGIR